MNGVTRLAACAIALAACTAACGKKGPPLPPLSTLPRAPEALTARLQGEQVQIRFRIPSVSQSNMRPASLQRVDVYALTGPTVPRGEFIESAALVASVPVRRPVPEGEEEAPPAPGDEDALAQGALAVVFETLTPEAYQPVVLREKKRRDEPRRRPAGPIVVRRTPLTPPDAGSRLELAPMRHYVAVGVARNGRKGLPSAVASVSLDPAPPAPPPFTADVREKGVELKWPLPTGLRRPVQRTTLAPRAPARPGPSRPGAPGRSSSTAGASPFGDEDEDDMPSGSGEFAAGEEGEEEEDDVLAEEAEPEQPIEPVPLEPEAPGDPEAGAPDKKDGDDAPAFLPARPLQPWPSVMSGFHVYAVPPEMGGEPRSPYAIEALPELLTPRPLLALQFNDSTAQFGDERCYLLRVVEISGTALREGPPSTPTCVKVADTFPPPAARSLAAVAGEGAVSLIWEASDASDLAGYLVLRSEGSGAPRELTPEPISETTFRDTRVRGGTRYVYVVIAVDKATPPNRSEASNAVEVFAR